MKVPDDPCCTTPSFDTLHRCSFHHRREFTLRFRRALVAANAQRNQKSGYFAPVQRGGRCFSQALKTHRCCRGGTLPQFGSWCVEPARAFQVGGSGRPLSGNPQPNIGWSPRDRRPSSCSLWNMAGSCEHDGELRFRLDSADEPAGVLGLSREHGLTLDKARACSQTRLAISRT
jgi:hypothetical protein